jgi:hypothetical protein
LFPKILSWRYPKAPVVEKTLTEIREASEIKNENTIKKYMHILLEKKDQLLQRALIDEPGKKENANRDRDRD